MSMELESKILTQRLIYDLEEYNIVSRKLNPQYIGSESLRSIVPLMEFIKTRQDSKEIIDEDPKRYSWSFKGCFTNRFSKERFTAI